MKYRKKPVVIDAIQWDGTEEGAKHIQENFDVVQMTFKLNTGRLEVFTLEGVMTASPKDWIVRGVKGEFYPVHPEIFNLTYEAA